MYMHVNRQGRDFLQTIHDPFEPILLSLRVKVHSCVHMLQRLIHILVRKRENLLAADCSNNLLCRCSCFNSVESVWELMRRHKALSHTRALTPMPRRRNCRCGQPSGRGGTPPPAAWRWAGQRQPEAALRVGLPALKS